MQSAPLGAAEVVASLLEALAETGPCGEHPAVQCALQWADAHSQDPQNAPLSAQNIAALFARPPQRPGPSIRHQSLAARAVDLGSRMLKPGKPPSRNAREPACQHEGACALHISLVEWNALWEYVGSLRRRSALAEEEARIATGAYLNLSLEAAAPVEVTLKHSSPGATPP